MNKFEAHINPSKTLELTRDNGEKDTFTIQPLPYKFMPEVFKVLTTLKDFEGVNEKDSGKFFELMNENAVKSIQHIVIESLKTSYPDEKVEILERFAANNLFEILPVVLEVNSFMSDNNIEMKKKMEAMGRMQDARNR